jgi:hypothetical protein
MRVGEYDLGRQGFAARLQLVKSPKAIADGPDNGELESVGLLAKGPYAGYYVALSEKNRDAADNIRGWLWRKSSTIPFTVKRFEDYDITDLALMDDGRVLILERSYVRGSLPGMAIRRFDPADVNPGGVVSPELVFAGRFPFYVIDNMEGLAICTRDGETRITLISDNNFDTALQSTLLLQFDYPP